MKNNNIFLSIWNFLACLYSCMYSDYVARHTFGSMSSSQQYSFQGSGMTLTVPPLTDSVTPSTNHRSLYWPITQFHHLVTHSWANWIKFTFSFISQVYFATKISTTILNSVNVQGWFERAGKCEWGSLSPNAIWSQNPGEIEKEKSPTLNFSNRPWRLKVAICRSKSNQNDEYRYWY